MENEDLFRESLEELGLTQSDEDESEYFAFILDYGLYAYIKEDHVLLQINEGCVDEMFSMKIRNFGNIMPAIKSAVSFVLHHL